jgi:HD superfamily phosphohydrolase YqeK
MPERKIESLSHNARTGSAPVLQDPCTMPGIAPYCELMRRQLSLERYQHTIRVAILADSIAHANGFTAEEVHRTALAAILHDAARELRPEELFALAPAESELELNHPLTVHGRAGRKLAQ